MTLCVTNNGALMRFDSEKGKPGTICSNIEMNGPVLDDQESFAMPAFWKSKRKRPVTVNFSFWRFLDFDGRHCAVYIEDDVVDQSKTV